MKYHQSPSTSSMDFYPSNSSFRSQSPLPPPATTYCLSATTKSYKYLRKLVKFNQMDFEFAMWQMIYLFISPQKLYRNFSYRKQTKSQFARDDPAFLVLLIATIFVTSIGFTWTLGLPFVKTIYCIFYVIIVDLLLIGFIVSTGIWFFTNRYLRERITDPDIEWGYCWDVHLNAFFPPLVLLHFIQLLFYNAFIDSSSFVSRTFGNTIWLIAIIYYIYITFLGYNCISFLKNTRIFLTPIPILFVFYIVTIIIGWNICRTFANFYREFSFL